MDSADAIDDPHVKEYDWSRSLFFNEIFGCVNGGVDFLPIRKSFITVIDFVGSSFGG